jgi:hypothetical protein
MFDFIQSTTSHNLKDPHSKALEPDCLSSPPPVIMTQSHRPGLPGNVIITYIVPLDSTCKMGFVRALSGQISDFRFNKETNILPFPFLKYSSSEKKLVFSEKKLGSQLRFGLRIGVPGRTRSWDSGQGLVPPS